MTSKTTKEQRAKLRTAHPTSSFSATCVWVQIKVLEDLLDDLEAAEKALAEAENIINGAWNLSETEQPYGKFKQSCEDVWGTTTSS